jgi:hypothetical protein
MRPKRPAKPPTPPPPLPAVVKPEDLDAINPPVVNKMPAYVSPGKFEWKTPPPGPKGDPGEVTRPITPPVESAEIKDGAVTLPKLDPTIVLGSKFLYFATRQVGMQNIGVSSGIDFTDIDLSSLVPVGASAILAFVSLENWTGLTAPQYARFQIRKDATQDICVSLEVPVSGREERVNDNCIIQLDANRKCQYRLEAYLTSANINLFVYVLGYII